MVQLRSILAVTLLAAAGAARADEPTFVLSGYGTLGVVHSDNRDADYLADSFKPSGPGYTRSWSADVDSRLGLQATANFGARFSAVVQVIAQQRYDDTYRPAVEWANVKYQATPDFSVRAGRVVLPIFMVTDSRKVGYANPWVRPPVEMYSLVPVTSNDGVDLAYRMPLGNGTNTFQVTAGRSDSKFPGSAGFGTGTAKARKLAAFVDTLEIGFATVRINYGQARLTIEELSPLFDAFRGFGPVGAAIADRYDLRGRRVDFLGLGASYDPGSWFVMAEAARFNTRSVVGEKTAWYVSGGHRFGKATAYATYARARAESATSDPGLPVAALPPQLAPVAAQLNAVLNSQLGAIPRQGTASAGVRWDFIRNAALKLQYDRVALDSGSAGTFGNLQPAFQRGGRVGIFSAALDFVF